MHPSISNMSHQVVPISLAFKQTSTVQTCTKLSNELPGRMFRSWWSYWPTIDLYTACWDQTKWFSLDWCLPHFMSHVFISRSHADLFQGKLHHPFLGKDQNHTSKINTKSSTSNQPNPPEVFTGRCLLLLPGWSFQRLPSSPSIGLS